MTAIKILSDEVIGQIAAGEVVERPASAVKELVENALDADANNIHIEVQEGGQRLIRISDDGGGIANDQARLALARHATSKLETANDLYRIRTLGFRGEALASIAAVSHLTLTTRQREESVGLEVRVEGGQILDEKPAGVPAGTVITIENLFYNVPARLKFLKSPATEKRIIQTIVTRYAMAYPEVRFTLVQDGREVFRSPGSGQLADVLVKVLGLDQFRDMIEISEHETVQPLGIRIGVYGFVSTPEQHRKDRTRIVFFVNGRNVSDNGLTYAVTQAYHMLLEKGRYPIAFLLVQVPPDFVDVNVHPTKAEVRFQDSNAVFVTVQRVVRRAVVRVAAQTGAYGMNAAPDYAENKNTWGLGGLHSTFQGPGGARDAQHQLDLKLESDDYGAAPSYDTPHYNSDDPTAIPEGPGRPDKPRTLPVLRVVGQIGATYIVAEGPAGLYLVNQHYAHHRVLYEAQIEALLQSGQVANTAIEPETVDVSEKQLAAIEAQQDLFTMLGFQVEPFGANTLMVRAMPEVAQDHTPADLLRAVLHELTEGKGASADSNDTALPLDRRLLRVICQRAALKTGQLLNTEQMQQIVRQLERTQNPRTSPDGKPTLVHFSAEQLAREFGQ